MHRATSIAIVTLTTIAIGAAAALGVAHEVRPATHLAGGVLPVSPSPSLGPTAKPSPPSTPTPAPDALPDAAQISAPSTTVAWALMKDDALLVSTDQAKSWVKRSLPMPYPGVRPMISFVDDRAGWYLAPGSPATQCQEAAAGVFHTADGATTWQRLNTSGIAPGQCKWGIYFVDAKHGFITAADPNHAPTIYRTSDGGTTWAGATLPDPPDFKSTDAGYVLSAEWIKSFGSTLYLEAHGPQDFADPHDRFYIFRSTDGGASWQSLTKVPSLGLAMVTESRWIILSTPGQSQETTTSGLQWHQLTTDYSQAAPVAPQIVFPDASVGYATVRGDIERTTDGGAHWTPIKIPGFEPQPTPPPSPSSIPMPTDAKLSAPSTNVLWALVAGQYLFRSTDQGKTWQQRTWLKLNGDALISFVDDQTGWALFRFVPATSCSDQGAQLWATTDGAVTWHPMGTLALAQCKDAMYFADAQHGWLATGDTVSSPTIWRTADGGLTWSASHLYDPRLQPTAGPSPRVSSVRNLGSTVLAYAAPDVFRSTDGGVGWAFAVVVPAQPKESVAFVTATRWLRVTHQSESVDSGASWHAFATDYDQAAGVEPVILFADDRVGYATVRGEVRRTLDGGAHWEMIKTSWP